MRPFAITSAVIGSELAHLQRFSPRSNSCENNWKLSYQAIRSASTNPCSHTEATMRIARRLLALSLLLANPARSALQSQAQPSAVTADTSVTVRWNRLVPRLVDENIARRRASRVMAWVPPAPALAGPWNGTIPTGPGMWYSVPGVPPIGIGLTNARPWLLDSVAQFRSPPPPAFGSPTWRAALNEVKRVGQERTAEQTSIAQLWNGSDPWERWNDIAATALLRHHASDADAARVFAVLNAAASDAIIACFDAKYHYWTIRPSQADSSIVLADSVQLPNFPSYPSGHACSAGAFDAVLGHYFPQDRAGFTRVAEEQAMSRLYGGIHYRFDNDEGLALGRRVARYDVEQERRGRLSEWRTVRR